MKTLLALLVTLTFSCQLFCSPSSGAETRKLSDFDKLSVNGNFNVILIQIDDEKASHLEIEAAKSQIPKIRTEVRDGCLNIFTSGSLENIRNVDIYLYIHNLTSIKAYGKCNIEAETNLKLTQVYINVSKESFLTLYLTTHIFFTDILGDGTVEIMGEIDELNVTTHDKINLILELRSDTVVCEIIDFSHVYLTDISKVKYSSIIDNSMIQNSDIHAKESIFQASLMCFYVTRN